MKYLLVMLCLLLAPALFAQVQYNAQNEQWRLRSGKNACLFTNTSKGIKQQFIVMDNDIAVNGTTGLNGHADYNLVSCMVNGEKLNTSDFILINHQSGSGADGVHFLTLTLKAKELPLQVSVTCKAYNNTGVFSRSATIKNMGDKPLVIAEIASLAALFPGGNYELQYLKTQWGQERLLTTETLQADSMRLFVINKGRSGEGYSSWFSLANKTNGMRYMAQLAYSGNWHCRCLYGYAVRYGKRAPALSFTSL